MPKFFSGIKETDEDDNDDNDNDVDDAEDATYIHSYKDTYLNS